MPLTELQIRQVDAAIKAYVEESRAGNPAVPTLRLRRHIQGSSVTLFELDDRCQDSPNRLKQGSEWPVAQCRFDERRGVWRLYRPDGKGRWRRCPASTAERSFSALLLQIGRDPELILWG